MPPPNQRLFTEWAGLDCAIIAAAVKQWRHRLTTRVTAIVVDILDVRRSSVGPKQVLCA